jgi:hypothetical protein
MSKIKFIKRREEEMKIKEDLARRAREKIKRKEKLSFEEFQALMEMDENHQL